MTVPAAAAYRQVSGEREFFAQMVVDAVTALDASTLDLKMIGMKKVRQHRTVLKPALWFCGFGGKVFCVRAAASVLVDFPRLSAALLHVGYLMLHLPLCATPCCGVLCAGHRWWLEGQLPCEGCGLQEDLQLRRI